MIQYRNNKTKKLYRLLAWGTDTTNSRDGEKVIIYCPDDSEHTIYVRKEEEFNNKFTVTQPGTENI
jgi:hypothetical protein